MHARNQKMGPSECASAKPPTQAGASFSFPPRLLLLSFVSRAHLLLILCKLVWRCAHNSSRDEILAPAGVNFINCTAVVCPALPAALKVWCAWLLCVRLLKNYTIRKFSSSACLRGVHCLFTREGARVVAKRSVICSLRSVMIGAFRSVVSGWWKTLTVIWFDQKRFFLYVLIL